MKDLKLIDILPAIFGAVALMALFGMLHHTLDYRVGFIVFFGCGLASAITGFTSKVLADIKHKRHPIYILNILCALSFGTLVAYVVFAFFNIPFTF